MKNQLLITLAMTTLAIADSQPPVGYLKAEDIVPEGTAPTLEWGIVHPSKDIDDLITIDDDDKVTTLKALHVDVYMVGTGVTSDGGKKQHETQAQIDLGGGYLPFFKGIGKDVTPSKALISKEVPSGTVINFQAYFSSKLGWKGNGSNEVIILKDDDAVPSELGQNGGQQLEDYLSLFIKAGKIDLGPFDYIYCAELTHTDSSSDGYDLQDSIVLVRFTELETLD